MAKNRSTAAPAALPDAESPDTEERFLLGPQQLQALLDQVASLGITGPRTTRSALSDRWRAAAQAYERLAKSEAGAADRPGVLPLPKAMGRHLAQLIELPGVRRTFDTVPVAFGLVELDKLVISQYSMTQAVVDHIVAAHPLPLSPRRLVCCARRWIEGAIIWLALRSNMVQRPWAKVAESVIGTNSYMSLCGSGSNSNGAIG